jgi:Lipopolysaccharide-assembly
MKAIPQLTLLALAAVALTLPSCESDGNFTVLGYTTKPNYDCSIHTVRVPIFKNRTFRQGIEFELTRAVVREIEQKTPYKVVGPDADADTELTGTILSDIKTTLNVNPLNEIREQETLVSVQVTWQNLRTGEYISNPKKPASASGPALPPLPGAGPISVAPGVIASSGVSAPTAPGASIAALTPPASATAPVIGSDGLPVPVQPAAAVLITATGNFIPELGESLATAQKKAVDRLAVQITSMMEKPW